MAFKSAAIDELKKTDLEYTLFINGFFMDYFGLPKVKSYLTPVVIVLDIQHKVAGIPGSGKTPVVFTTTKDVGRFVVASLGLEKWSERSIMVGDRKTWNEVVEIAEKVTGNYDNLDSRVCSRTQADSIVFKEQNFRRPTTPSRSYKRARLQNYLAMSTPTRSFQSKLCKGFSLYLDTGLKVGNSISRSTRGFI